MTIVQQWLAAVLLAAALPAVAGVYTYIDAQGNRVFTDRPGGRAVESVDTRPVNSMPAQPVAPSAPPPEAPPEPAFAYRLLDIVQPEPDATIRNNAGDLSVSVASEPTLQPDHLYRLLLDGSPIAPDGSEPVFALHNIDRGTHQLIVEVVDNQGQTLQRSSPRTFHLLRTSLAQRRRVNPCQNDDYGVRPECPLKDKPEEKKDIPFVPFL
ncbi:penicillin-binding protein [Stutzerimonas stutzeri]|uniref:Penicillin-binding protein n=1 Tax=Stutzerimonas stutzeri TaxID=316 RepID=W8R671_STUST|nr:DUF4124 domain-containing protein [Stutzerimonas stutzeri]AHL73797.1 penicillin-binding protein [Stutzerimonas stutzeri]MCQ4328687.1 DUF4124 domain-containing protein [Stutzerimonas stutzeri]